MGTEGEPQCRDLLKVREGDSRRDLFGGESCRLYHLPYLLALPDDERKENVLVDLPLATAVYSID